MKIREIKLKKNKERTNSLKKNSFLQIGTVLKKITAKKSTKYYYFAKKKNH